MDEEMPWSFLSMSKCFDWVSLLRNKRTVTYITCYSFVMFYLFSIYIIYTIVLISSATFFNQYRISLCTIKSSKNKLQLKKKKKKTSELNGNNLEALMNGLEQKSKPIKEIAWNQDSVPREEIGPDKQCGAESVRRLRCLPAPGHDKRRVATAMRG